MDHKGIGQLLSSFSQQRLVVVGDVMLDTYYWGHVSRTSPEAPVPIVAVDQTEHRPGGAANVANNLHSLGAAVDLVGVVGQDTNGGRLEETLSAYGIPTQLLVDPGRPTTQKTRVIAGPQHVVRLDRETDKPLDDALGLGLVEAVGGVLPGAGGLVLQDYHKGTLPGRIVRQLCDLAREQSCPVFVDPKFDNLDAFEGAALLKPNLAEAEQFAGVSLEDEADLEAAGQRLRDQFKVAAVLITRGALGMNLFDGDGHHRIPTRPRRVADVCGAGDTVISTYALAAVAGASAILSAELANFAAGKVVEEMGVVPITLQQLEEFHQDSKG